MMAVPHSPQLVNTVDAQWYNCALHDGILEHAMQTRCGHRFCKSCIDKWLETHENSKCPANEEDCAILASNGENATHINPDTATRKDISNLKVYCSFKVCGCPETISWKTLLEHEATCGFKQIECSNKCGKFVKETDLDEHIMLQCDERVVTCEYCKVFLRFKLLETHQSVYCPEVEVTCAYNCEDQPIKRGELQTHLEKCPNKPIQCLFKSRGCAFEYQFDSEWCHHQADSTNQHLELLNKSLETEKSEIVKIIEEKDIEIKSLRETVQHQKIQMETLTNRTIVLERKVKERKDGAEQLAQCLERLNIQEARWGRVVEDDLRKAKELEDLKKTMMSNTLKSTSSSADVAIQLARCLERLNIQEARWGSVAEDMEIRFQCADSTGYNGILFWKIPDYKTIRHQIGWKPIDIYSQPFYTDRHGYKMCAQMCTGTIRDRWRETATGGRDRWRETATGGWDRRRETAMSLYIYVMRGEYDDLISWPFSKKVTCKLLDQTTGGDHWSKSFTPATSHPKMSDCYQKPTSEMNNGFGFPKFVTQTTLEQKKYLLNDTIFIKVVLSDVVPK